MKPETRNTNTNAIWQQLLDWFQLRGRRPYDQEQAIALALEVKRMWEANGRRQMVYANRLMPNITNELRRLRQAGGNDQLLAQIFVSEIGHKSGRKIRAHELYPGLMSGMREAIGLPKKITKVAISMVA